MCQLMRKDISTLSFKLKEVMEELRTFKDKVRKICLHLVLLMSFISTFNHFVELKQNTL